MYVSMNMSRKQKIIKPINKNKNRLLSYNWMHLKKNETKKELKNMLLDGPFQDYKSEIANARHLKIYLVLI